MGKIMCGMSGGYESPAYGSWALGITGQGIVFMLFVMLLSGNSLPLNGAEENQLQYADRTTFTALAATHAVCAVVIAVFTLLGYLLSSCFLCPLGILSIGVQVALLTTCGICGSLLSASVDFTNSMLEAVRAGTSVPVPNLSETFVLQEEGKLVLICILCLVAVVPFSRGVSLDVSAPAYEALLYAGSLTLIVASASVFLFIRAVPGLAGLAVAWICVALVIGIATVVQKCCCSRILAIGLSAVFFVSALFGIVSASAICAVFMEGKRVYLHLALTSRSTAVNTAITALTEKQFESYKAFALANNGVYLIVATCFNVAAIVYTVYSGLNCLRTVCDCSRKTHKDDEDKSSDVA